MKIFGPDLDVLEKKAVEIKIFSTKHPGYTELTVVRELGQPSLIVDIDRPEIARYGINVADVEAVVQTAVGGQAATQVIQGEKLFDLVVRMEPQIAPTPSQIANLLVPTPGRPADSLVASWLTLKNPRGLPLFIAKIIRAHRHSVFESRAATSEGICSGGPGGSRKIRATYPRAKGWIGAGSIASCWEAKTQLYVISPLLLSF